MLLLLFVDVDVVVVAFDILVAVDVVAPVGGVDVGVAFVVYALDVSVLDVYFVTVVSLNFTFTAVAGIDVVDFVVVVYTVDFVVIVVVIAVVVVVVIDTVFAPSIIGDVYVSLDVALITLHIVVSIDAAVVAIIIAFVHDKIVPRSNRNF